METGDFRLQLLRHEAGAFIERQAQWRRRRFADAELVVKWPQHGAPRAIVRLLWHPMREEIEVHRTAHPLAKGGDLRADLVRTEHATRQGA